MSKTNIVLSGVGGQGVITAANILGKAAVKAKMNVYTSEVHGMAQRGGSVYCTVRIGDVTNPLIPYGRADVILSMEPIEALRWISYANKNTKIITDITPVIPFTVTIAGESYPKLEDVFEELGENSELYTIDALDLAKKSGDIIVKNIVMLGALAGIDILPFSSDILLDTILETVPDKYREMNENAFKNGLEAIKTS
ncbi:MAG TPA: indolepyruvate ferredoxin oxidoreductase subunit beta [Thermoplasmatales archaeon]|nr:indolepyruvate ferredoxin oxidoreductase subunit beta [Thermoplasmatales archaeon]